MNVLLCYFIMRGTVVKLWDKFSILWRSRESILYEVDMDFMKLLMVFERFSSILVDFHSNQPEAFEILCIYGDFRF